MAEEIKEAQDPTWPSKWPQKDYDKKIWSFSIPELIQISGWDVVVQQGIVANRVIQGTIKEVVFKRLGVKNSPDIGFEYDSMNNKLYTYIPKVWCSLCKNRIARFSISDGRVFCEGCIEILKTQAKQQEEQNKTTNVKQKVPTKPIKQPTDGTN